MNLQLSCTNLNAGYGGRLCLLCFSQGSKSASHNFNHYPLDPTPHGAVPPYHNFRGYCVNHYVLKSCILLESDALWITGRSPHPRSLKKSSSQNCDFHLKSMKSFSIQQRVFVFGRFLFNQLCQMLDYKKPSMALNTQIHPAFLSHGRTNP
jgi:hypothetical protein